MRLAGAVGRVLLVILALTLAAPAIATLPAVAAQDDASRFAELLAARAASASLAGPLFGELVKGDGFSVTTGAGLSVEDFSARATFVNPATGTETPWDFGFTFHRSGEAAQQVLIDSPGLWHYSPFPEGTLESGFVPDFDAAPGGADAVDLIVDGDSALLGVNGEFLTSIELPPAIPSDVQIGSGYFTAATVDGRAIPYRDFEVWALPGADIPEPTAAAEPTFAAEPAPTISPDDVAAFATILASQSQVEPLAGPFAGRLAKSSPGTAPLAPAGVALADFGAVATFVAPEDVSDGLWDAGIQFRSDADVTHRLILGFNGEVYAVLPGESPRIVGTATTIDATPGAANALPLFVEAGRALVGVNGEFVAAIDLVHEPVAADVLAGAAFFDEDFERGRVTAYEDFQIWEIA